MRTGTGRRTSTTLPSLPSATHQRCSSPHSLHRTIISWRGNLENVRSSASTPEFTSWPVFGHVNTIIELIPASPFCLGVHEYAPKYGRQPCLRAAQYVRSNGFSRRIAHGCLPLRPGSLEVTFRAATKNIAAGRLRFGESLSRG